ncbi:50S ribosomal protein L13 [Patescibacteria group bacterium]
MKTFSPKKDDVKRQWYLVDAKGQTLGRLATKVAVKLRGKDKPMFAPHVDCGDFVVIINAADIKVTGDKMNQKMYHRHSGYPGALKSTPLKKVMAKNPEEVVSKAIAGMIPRNKLKKEVLKKLKVFAGAQHAHEAQKPQPLN